MNYSIVLNLVFNVFVFPYRPIEHENILQEGKN